jgi:polyphosphate glucokinase
MTSVLVIDIGGTHVKDLATGQDTKREFISGPSLTPKRMVSKVRKLVADWKYEAISIGYPGPVLRNRPVSAPWNLGKGWAGFNFEAAFRRPVKVVNDAAMQALGSYKGGNKLAPSCRVGDNANAFIKGFRLWQKSGPRNHSTRAERHPDKRERARFNCDKETKTKAV